MELVKVLRLLLEWTPNCLVKTLPVAGPETFVNRLSHRKSL